MVRQIKRYGGGSRKLYDTEESRYVSLEEIAAWIRGGQEIRIVDAGSGEDVTAPTLAQIIYEDHRTGHALLPTDFLHDVIRRGSRAIAEGVEKVQHRVDRLVKASVDRLTHDGVQEELDQLRERLSELEASLAGLGPAGAARRGKRRSKRS